MILYAIALAFVVAIVLGMLTLVASVVVGVMTVGNLWSLLPLSIYALVFWMLAQLAKSL